MKRKEVEKLISACEVDIDELKENMYRNSYKDSDEEHADINARLYRIENGRYR